MISNFFGYPADATLRERWIAERTVMLLNGVDWAYYWGWQNWGIYLAIHRN